MKLAIVFDDLIQYGGAERLLLAIHELYPVSPVFTSLASNEWLEECKKRNIDLRTSFMQKLPFRVSLNRFYGLLGLHALAFESFRFDDFDVVLSISARFAHSVITKPQTKHICYMNSPGRMLWESWDYFEREKFLQNRFIRWLFWTIMCPFLTLLRLWDYTCAQRVDFFIANSKTPQARIRKYYGRSAKVVYPFLGSLFEVEGKKILSSCSNGCNDQNEVMQGSDFALGNGSYYLVISRLSSWKRIDIAVEACKMLCAGLKVVGDGPDKKRLIKIAKQNSKTFTTLKSSKLNGRKDCSIEFLGYVSEEEKLELIKNCRALIITQNEDFGITALEAMALGKPVIAFRAGGATETMVEGVTGEFFDCQTAQCLAEVLSKFNPSIYKKENCVNQALKFTKDKFLNELDDLVKKVYDYKSPPDQL